MENNEKKQPEDGFGPLTKEQVTELAGELTKIREALVNNNKQLSRQLFFNRIKIVASIVWFYATWLPKWLIFIPGAILFSIITATTNMKAYRQAKNREEMRDVGYHLITSQSDFRVKIMLLGLLFYFLLYLLIF